MPAMTPRIRDPTVGSSNAALELSGVTPVAAKPRYQDPMSVSLPLLSRNAALAPTLELVERNAPK